MMFMLHEMTVASPNLTPLGAVGWFAHMVVGKYSCVIALSSGLLAAQLSNLLYVPQVNRLCAVQYLLASPSCCLWHICYGLRQSSWRFTSDSRGSQRLSFARTQPAASALHAS